MQDAQKEQEPNNNLTDEDEDFFSIFFNSKGDEVFRDTVIEICLFFIILLTFDSALFLRKGSTDRSLVHSVFRPLDYFMYDPEVDRRSKQRRRKGVNSKGLGKNN
eukprot:TRINITY_DN4059_c0_g1_i2.p1 TRINITY_DN4059_c0_g1~~TRINITY_DN4059_c0_g1_i2.p1  ORF type:complete len:105 (-),score=8.21 TRINITY_DN4059_c0_g1_i2:183-497(-)